MNTLNALLPSLKHVAERHWCSRLLRTVAADYGISAIGPSSTAVSSRVLLESLKTVSSHVPSFTSVRCSSTAFFNTRSSKTLWHSVTSVSKAGAQKGRGRTAKKKFTGDLNRGQIIGVGRNNMVWPGLNSPIMYGTEIVRQEQKTPNPNFNEELRKLRKSLVKKRDNFIHPLDRGWTSSTIKGRNLGPPDPYNGETFDGFESVCVDYITVTNMDGLVGRRRFIRTIVITGNGNGLVGFAIGRKDIGSQSLRKARNKAGQLLWHIPRYQDRTVVHDFWCRFGPTQLTVRKRPPGFGFVGNRVLGVVCKLAGIKDVEIFTDGPKNPLHVVRAFILGLHQQKSFQELANEQKLHLVEITEGLPKVVASPDNEPVRTKDQIGVNEVVDFGLHVLDGKVQKFREEKVPWQERVALEYGWSTRPLKDYIKRRCFHEMKMDLVYNYGCLRSFLTDQYPESNGFSRWSKRLPDEEEEEGEEEE